MDQTQQNKYALMGIKQGYFTSPLGEINHCNECGEPIEKTEGRYHIDIQEDIYFSDGHRYLHSYGYKTFCEKCFKKLFGEFKFKNATSIYKKKEDVS